MLVFDEDIGAALGKACEQDSDSDAARAAQIVQRNIFRSNPFTGLFEENCQEKSVPHQLLALVSMVLEGPNIKDQIGECCGGKQAVVQVTVHNPCLSSHTGAVMLPPECFPDSLPLTELDLVGNEA